MTLEQACGIVNNTIDERTGRELNHRDKLFNNTGLGLWQNAAGYTAGNPECFFGGIWMLYRQNDIDVASCTQGVCILKEAARTLIERGET